MEPGRGLAQFFRAERGFIQLRIHSNGLRRGLFSIALKGGG